MSDLKDVRLKTRPTINVNEAYDVFLTDGRHVGYVFTDDGTLWDAGDGSGVTSVHRSQMKAVQALLDKAGR